MSSEYASGDMAAMMFDNLADMDVGQDFMAEVFYDIAYQSPETLMAMAAADQALYETMAYDPYDAGTGMSADDLMKDIMVICRLRSLHGSYDDGRSLLRSLHRSL